MRRHTWLPLLLLATAALVALIVSALHPMQIRAYALGSPDGGQAAVLARGQEACEGPIRLPSAIGGAGIWGRAIGGKAQLEVSIRDSVSGRSLANGQTTVPPVVDAYSIPLRPSIPAGSTVRVCVTDRGPVAFALFGSLPTHLQIRMSVGGKLTFSEFSLVLFEPTRHSLLGALPTAFSRAALFRFSWVGPWTFWLLAIALLGTIGLCGWAVAAAARAEVSDEARSETEAETSLPTHPSAVAR